MPRSRAVQAHLERRWLLADDQATTIYALWLLKCTCVSTPCKYLMLERHPARSNTSSRGGWSRHVINKTNNQPIASKLMR